MANDYSRDDLFRMQQDALRRVQEMQDRARRTVEQTNSYGIPFDVPAPSFRESRPEPEPESKPHPAFHAEPKQKPPPKLPTPDSAKKKGGFPGLNIAGINLTGDHALIISLLLLLYSEDADKTLILALLYIMF